MRELKSKKFVKKALTAIAFIVAGLVVVWLNLDNSTRANIKALTIANGIVEDGAIYEIGPIEVAIPQTYEVNISNEAFFDRIKATSKNNTEIIIDIYPTSIGIQNAIKMLMRKYDSSNVYGFTHTFSKFYGSKSHQDVMFTEFSDSHKLLRGEFFCFEEKGYTISLFSYGRYRDYHSVRELIDRIKVKSFVSQKTEEDVRSEIDFSISLYNENIFTLPIGGPRFFPRKYDGGITNVIFSVNHNDKIITQTYMLSQSQKSILNRWAEWSEMIDAIKKADNRNIGNCFVSDQTLAPLLYWTATLNGYIFKDLFLSADNKIIE